MTPRLSAFFLVGPTAAGKSEVAERIAADRDWDLLSADSMMVYTGMDIGTAKPSPAVRARLRYHGLDRVNPDQPFNVWEYRRHALDVLRRNAAEGRPTIVVGGTGLYIRALVQGLDPATGADEGLRAHGAELLKTGGIAALQDLLRQKDPAALAALDDPLNPRRLIRALEKAGQPGAARTVTRLELAPMAGLTLDPDALARRIQARVEGMFQQGIEAEVRTLLARYPALSDTARQAIGYAEVIDGLAGRCSRAEAIERIVRRTRQYAKRQRTWFRHQVNVKWIDFAPDSDIAHTAERVREHWDHHGATDIQDD